MYKVSFTGPSRPRYVFFHGFRYRGVPPQMSRKVGVWPHDAGTAFGRRRGGGLKPTGLVGITRVDPRADKRVAVGSAADRPSVDPTGAGAGVDRYRRVELGLGEAGP